MLPLFDVSWLTWLGVALASTQLTILCVTVYLHRCQAHRALDVHPWLSHAIRLWLWLTTSMSTLEWVAVHRKHHAHCETPEDPHSPKHHGLWTVIWKGVQLYGVAARDPATVERYGRGAPSDWLENRVYRRFRYLGVGLTALAFLVCFGLVKGGLLAAVQFAWIPFWAAGIINGVGHAGGYRTFASSDASRNIVPWGLWIGGEELHNNHHAHPTSAKLSYQWWEVDIGWGAIRLLSALGLANVRRTTRPPRLNLKPGTCSPAVLQSVVQQKLLIRRWYDSAVQGVVRDLRAKRRLSRTQARFVASGWARQTDPSWHRAISSHKELALLRAQWADLQLFWTNRTYSTEELARQLGQWCTRSEQSGVARLAEVSLNMRRLPAL